MQFTKSITGAAVLLAFAQSAMAIGSATVVNNCGYDVYYASVAQSQTASMKLIQGSYTEQFSKQNVGISIKLAKSLTGEVSQFEYTWVPGNSVAYDLSNIDGYPFADGGMQVVPSMQGGSAFPTCVVIDCPAGSDYCDAAYNLPDDTRTMVCDEDANLVLTMCPGGSGASAEARSSSTEAAASTPTSTAVASVTSSTTASATSAAASKQGGHRNHNRNHSRQFK